MRPQLPAQLRCFNFDPVVSCTGKQSSPLSRHQSKADYRPAGYETVGPLCRLQPHSLPPDPFHKHHRPLILPSPLHQIRHQRNEQHAPPNRGSPIRRSGIHGHADGKAAENKGNGGITKGEQIDRQAPAAQAEAGGR